MRSSPQRCPRARLLALKQSGSVQCIAGKSYSGSAIFQCSRVQRRKHFSRFSPQGSPQLSYFPYPIPFPSFTFFPLPLGSFPSSGKLVSHAYTYFLPQRKLNSNICAPSSYATQYENDIRLKHDMHKYLTCKKFYSKCRNLEDFE